MDRSIIDVPLNWFGIAAMDDWHIDVRGRSLGEGVSGDGQVVYGNQPRFVVGVQMPIFDKDKVAAWRVVTAKKRGRVNVWRVRAYDILEPSLADIGATGTGSGITFSDGATFSDAVGFSQSITAPILAAAAAGATEVSFDGSYVKNVLDGGMLISIDDWLYRVTGVEGTGTSAVATVEPPLRRAVTTLDEINLNPTALVVFETDMEGRLGLTPPWFGKTGASLIEWTNRP